MPHLMPLCAPPAPAEIRDRRVRLGLTQTQAGQLVHTTCRTWQQWEAPVQSKTHRRMHPAFWELFVLKTSTD